MKIAKVQKIHHQKAMLHAWEESCYCQCSQPPEFSFEEIPLGIPNEITLTIPGGALTVMKIVKVQKIHHQRVMLRALEESC